MGFPSNLQSARTERSTILPNHRTGKDAILKKSITCTTESIKLWCIENGEKVPQKEEQLAHPLLHYHCFRSSWRDATCALALDLASFADSLEAFCSTASAVMNCRGLMPSHPHHSNSAKAEGMQYGRSLTAALVVCLSYKMLTNP